MIDLHEVLKITDSINYKLPAEKVYINELFQRILREEIISDVNMPPFDKSAVDGFACRKADLDKPLKLIGTIYAGENKSYLIEPGMCVKITTGAAVPAGADCVIMVEDTVITKNEEIQFTKNASKSNICKLGEDVQQGERLLLPGTLLLPHHLSILASAGYEYVHVSAIPRVGLISTGNELVEPGLYPGKSQIRNSNAYHILAQLKSMGIPAFYGGIVPDDMEIISLRLSELSEQSDVVIITGGASMGEHDHVPTVLHQMGYEVLFNKIAIQPGKPVSFAMRSNKFCFGLSGNPVSSYLQFELLVKSFLYHLMGHHYHFPIVLSEINKSLHRKQSGRLKFFPVAFDKNGRAKELQFNGSAHIAGLRDADGFGLFPQNCETLDAGDKIEVLLIR